MTVDKKPDWDTIDRCGVGIFSTDPEKDELTPACADHDERALKGGTPEEWFASEMRLLKDGWTIAGQQPTWFGRMRLRARILLYVAIDNSIGRIFWKPYDRTQPREPNE